MSPRELVELLRSPYVDDQLAEGLCAVVVPADDVACEVLAESEPGALPVVIIGVGSVADPQAWPDVFDVVLTEDDQNLDAVLATIEANPIASASLAVLLRGTTALSVDHGLAAESAVYSLLQSGSEFLAWQATAPRKPAPPDAEPAVLASRDGDVLSITLNRPHRHNAFSRSMRDALSEALSFAVIDDSIARIEISGNGPSFCSGGDLGEFGSFIDPASAHTTRLTRSPARLLHRVRDRTRVHLHGACVGAGIELSAFAARVSAHPDAQIALPEISLGLIPGAGGTVSVTRRVGRQRCAQLALLGQPITAETALAWGLIDEIDAGASIR
jgi:enoyl-CoA hydratase/carnithine racemase